MESKGVWRCKVHCTYSSAVLEDGLKTHIMS
jgi:hypothetical protein